MMNMSIRYEPILTHPRLFTVETDIGVDCDDTGALAILFRTMRERSLPLGAVISCSSNQWGCGAASAIAEYYGLKNLPLAMPRDGDYLTEERYHVYDRVLAEEYSEGYRNGSLACEDAIEAYIRLMEQAPPNGVVLITVGPLHLMGELWDRASGLITEKVHALICMGGVYGQFEKYGHREYNFFTHADATKKVFENFPCPIYCIGMELGRAIPAGFERADPRNPVNRAYEIHTKGRMQRPTWDPLTVLFALEGEGERFSLSKAGRNEIMEDGSNHFHPDPNGKHFYVMAKKSFPELIREMNQLLSPPDHQSVY
ncbi:MAG: hypothetical protein E7620_03215 [Ruminococcaceae bacterium]|nr:hypothetical protein [Oscillospiraceae bacterium]